MLSWLARSLNSSIGKKAVMALTGLMLIGFLFFHLVGNLTLFGSDQAFADYVSKLQGLGPLLLVMEVLLLLLFSAHIFLGLRVSMENREARSRSYSIRNSRGKSTISSTSMLLTGVIVLGFLIKHLLDFRFQAGEFHERPAGMVRDLLASTPHALLYVLGVTALGFHLAHAFRSAAQSLGVSHPKLTPVLEKLSLVVALALWAGFMSFPVLFWIQG